MAIKDELSAEDWQTLCSAPFAAALYVASASGGTLELIKELFSVVKDIGGASQRGASGFGPLADAVLAEIKNRQQPGVLGTRDYEALNSQDMRLQARQMVEAAGKLADAHMGGEGYKRWLETLAKRAAESSHTGWLGKDRNVPAVDPAEQAAVSELREMLR